MSDDTLTIPVLPDDAEERKNIPIFDGFLNYFPLAAAAVARHSKTGNDQHNPGLPLHWSRDKSTDHVNCIARHLIDAYTRDPQTGEYLHARGLAWRAMALLQILEEQRLGKPMCRAGKLTTSEPAMPVTEKVINVVVGVLFAPSGRVFLQRRRLDDENFPGRWECPGGGVEPGESDEDALARELKEELGIEAGVGPLLWKGAIRGYLSPNRMHVFRFYEVNSHHTPAARDGQPAIMYATMQEATEMALTPANMLAWPAVEKRARQLAGGGR